MKKFLVLLMSVCMLCMMGTACADDAAERDLVAMLQGIVGETLSLADYEGLDDADAEYLGAYLIDGEYIELDGVLTVGGTEIVLPMLYGDFVDAGWTSQLTWEDPVKANSLGIGTYTNAAGETISVSFTNRTQEQQSLAKTWVESISAGQTVNEFTATFDAKGIHAGSTLAELVEAWGKPYRLGMSCYENEDGLDVTTRMEYSSVYGSVTFFVDAETSLITGLNYSLNHKAD